MPPPPPTPVVSFLRSVLARARGSDPSCKTPSPHRFVIKKPSRPPPTPQQETPLPASQRFNPTPRFYFAPSHSQVLSSTPNLTRYGTSLQLNQIDSDSIEDASDQPDVRVETDEDFIGSQDSFGEDKAVHYKSKDFKRQRLSTPADVTRTSVILDNDDYNGIHATTIVVDNKDDPEATVKSPNPIVSSPLNRQAHRPPPSVTAPYFVVPITPAPLLLATPSGATAASAFQRPPRFRPPDEQDQHQPTEPLPDVFSPHRRGQKHIAGGLAAEVVGWLVDLENKTSSHTRNAVKRETWPVKIMVDEFSGSTRAGLTLLCGNQVHLGLNVRRGFVVDDLGVVKVALAGSGTGTGIERAGRVEIGKLIGIKPPIWEVVLKGESWGIVVDWKVLDKRSTIDD